MGDVLPSWRERAQAVLDAKAKPPGSLGALEEWAVALCGAQRTLEPVAAPASLIVFAADHGTTRSILMSLQLCCQLHFYA